MEAVGKEKGLAAGAEVDGAGPDDAGDAVVVAVELPAPPGFNPPKSGFWAVLEGAEAGAADADVVGGAKSDGLLVEPLS